MPPNEHHPHSGVYWDACAPHYHTRVSHLVAIVVGLLMWVVIIVAAVAAYRALNG